MEEKIIEIVKKSGVFLLLFIVEILCITTVLFFFNITVSKLHLPIIYIVTTITFVFFYKKDGIKRSLLSLLIGTVIFILSIFVLGKLYDLTADGNTYHKLAIGALKNGWNPTYEESMDFTVEKGNVFNILEDNVNTLWVDHYAKGTEIFASVIYAFTGNIESRKSLHSINDV